MMMPEWLHLPSFDIYEIILKAFSFRHVEMWITGTAQLPTFPQPLLLPPPIPTATGNSRGGLHLNNLSGYWLVR